VNGFTARPKSLFQDRQPLDCIFDRMGRKVK
jgi:hypothetical protein